MGNELRVLLNYNENGIEKSLEGRIIAVNNKEGSFTVLLTNGEVKEDVNYESIRFII